MSVDEIYPSVFTSLVSEYEVDRSVVEGVILHTIDDVKAACFNATVGVINHKCTDNNQ